MRARTTSVFLILAAAAGACTTAFGAAAPDPTDTPPVGDAAPLPTADAQATNEDANRALEGIEGGALAPPPIGQGCAGRVPPWQECLDFEDSRTGEKLTTGGGSVAVKAGVKGQVLQISAPTSGDIAYTELRVADQAQAVVWSFDVNIYPGVADGTELATLNLPIKNGDECTLLIGRRGATLRTLEHCRIGDIPIENLIDELPLPISSDGWFNIFVEANFSKRTVATTLRAPDGSIDVGSGKLDTSVVGTKATLGIGVAFAPKPSAVAVDNIVIWSR